VPWCGRLDVLADLPGGQDTMEGTMSTATAGPVVAGVDGSDEALNAVRWAAAEARSTHLPLRLVHASVWPMVSHPVPPGVPTNFRRMMEEQAQQALQQAREVAEQTGPGTRISTELRVGAPGPVLIDESTHAREVVIASRGLGGITGLLVGSTAMTLVQHAACPVVVVRAEGDPGGPIVVGIDTSPSCEQVLTYAFDAASRTLAPLLVVHTWSDIGVGELLAPAGRLVNWESVEDHEQRALAERLAGWQEKYPDVAVARAVPQDQPARRLLELSERARLLVVGSRGRGGFTGLLLGSTSRAVVQHASCPVAVVRS
jgi:nucleotide-binding universal stress UspA family protein